LIIIYLPLIPMTRMSKRIIVFSASLFSWVFIFYAHDAGATVLGTIYGAPPDPQPRVAFTRTMSVVWAATVGDQVVFNVDKSFDAQGRTQLTATLRIVGARAYFYVENDYFSGLSAQAQADALSAIQTVANEFDNNIYPKETAVFGTPWEPGIDNDTRITILVSRLVSNAGGYFRTDDEYPKNLVPTSNEREMVFVNAANITNITSTKNFLAHEFQHLISFYQKVKLRDSDDDVWLNEARSEYATTVAGYNTTWNGSYLQSRALSFLSNPTDSITEWKNSTEDYAGVTMFSHYLADHYGVAVITRSLQRAEQGIASIDAALAELGYSDRFADIVQNWEIASYINSAATGTKYAYKNALLGPSNFKISQVTSTYNFSGTSLVFGESMKDWAGRWNKIQGTTASMKLAMTSVSSGAVFRAAAIVANKNGTYEVRSFPLVNNQGELVIGGVGTTVDHVVFVPTAQAKTANFTNSEPTRTYNMAVSFVDASALSISSASPAVVHTSGGASVTLSGSGFVQGMTLTVGGVSTTPVVSSATSLSFTAPAAAGSGATCISATVSGTSSQNCAVLRYISFTEGSLVRAQGDTKVWIVKGKWRRHIVNPAVFTFYPHLGFSSVQDISQSELAALSMSAWVRVPITVDPLTWRVYEVNGDASKHWITCADPDNCASTWLSRGGNPDGIYTINQSEMNYYTTGVNVFLQ